MGVLYALILILLGFCTILVLSNFAFHCPPTWLHDENVDCPHLYHEILGSCTLIVEVLKYFLIFGGFVRFDSDPLGNRPMVLLSIFAFLCPPMWLHDENVDCPHLYHVIMGSYTLIYCLSIKIFSHFWGFCPLWFWSFGAFVLWCFCQFLLFSVRPCDRKTSMLIDYTCIRWSWDCTPWLLEY